MCSHWHNNLDDYGFRDFGFRSARKKGKLDLAKWFYNKWGTKLRSYNAYAFTGACENGHHDIVK